MSGMKDGDDTQGMRDIGGNGTGGTTMMMHMTFFWGKNGEILFSGWPGRDNSGTYLVALVFVFALSLFVEWLSHCDLIKESYNEVAAGLLQTLLYGITISFACVLMLAVMSFNGGVFIVVVAGHALGFLFFGSRLFKKSSPPLEKTSDLPPMSC